MQKLSSRCAALLALATLAGALLTACAPEPTPEPAETQPPDAAAPLFASDEEALAAATAIYAHYLLVSDAVLAAGGESTQALQDVAVGRALEYELAGARDFASKGLRATGSTLFEVARLQSVKQSQVDGVEVRFYVCDDLSGTDLLDAAGESQVVPEGQVIFPFEVAVVGAVVENLRVSEKNLWTGGGIC